MYIKFTGEFKSLKSIGFEFRKLYANNHICYKKDEIWVWKKEKDVEIDSLYGNSHILLQYLIDNNFIIDDKYNVLILNNETMCIEKYEPKKHESFLFLDKTATDEETLQFFNRYTKLRVKQETIDEIKHLYNSHLIAITESEITNTREN